jgi:hypothetical protein
MIPRMRARRRRIGSLRWVSDLGFGTELDGREGMAWRVIHSDSDGVGVSLYRINH